MSDRIVTTIGDLSDYARASGSASPQGQRSSQRARAVGNPVATLLNRATGRAVHHLDYDFDGISGLMGIGEPEDTTDDGDVFVPVLGPAIGPALAIPEQDKTPRAMIQLGSRGADVQAWQQIIGVTSDGVFGPDTDKATRAWQASHGLAVDGIVGPQTWASAGQVGQAAPAKKPSTSAPAAVSGGSKSPAPAKKITGKQLAAAGASAAALAGLWLLGKRQ